MITIALLCYFAASLALALGMCRSGAIEDRMLNESSRALAELERK